jgi:hypothetical protein
LYTLDDLEKARDNLKIWSKRWEDYSGNNPNKFQADIKAARREVRSIESSLKTSGVIELSEHEKLEQKLDIVFPNAHSKDVVEFEGKKYIRRFFPLEHSRSRKTVTQWGKEWEIQS